MIIRVTSSAALMAHQIPLIPKIAGRISSAANWITRVLRKEIVAEIIPLLRPVKKPEPNILNPQNRNEVE